MTSLLFPMGPKPTPSLNGIWEYWRPPGSSIVELGIVRGLDVALPIHFHEEDQLTTIPFSSVLHKILIQRCWTRSRFC